MPSDTYFAVQIHKQETTHEVAKIILDAAEAQGLKFTKLEVLENMPLGTMTFVRFRTDLQTVGTMLAAVQAQGRGVVWAPTGEFQAKLLDGKVVPIPMVKMLVARTLPLRIYRGTKMTAWQAQFKKTA